MKNKTVFIVGAGASKEVGLPTGHELKSKISELLNICFDDFGHKQISGSPKLQRALGQATQNTSNYDFHTLRREAVHISEALPLAISIDNFIDAHRDNERIALCGKLAIVEAILEAESQSYLYSDMPDGPFSVNFNEIDKTWLIALFKQLTENCRVKDLSARFSNVVLIIFNYDRCLEHFLFNALRGYYGISEHEAFNLINKISIYHPYGYVGPLPWNSNHERSETVPFGARLSPEKLLELSSKIKTFAEGTNPGESEIIKIREHIDNTERLVFMGFAFHRLNLELIAPESSSITSSTLKCFATAYGISVSDQEAIRKDLQNILKRPMTVQMATATCGDFFNEFWRSLSF